MGDKVTASAMMSVILLIVGFAVAGLIFTFAQAWDVGTGPITGTTQEIGDTFEIVTPMVITISMTISICLILGLLAGMNKDVPHEEIDTEIPFDKAEDKISTNEAIQIAKRRFVRGEITKEEYTLIRSRL